MVETQELELQNMKWNPKNLQVMQEETRRPQKASDLLKVVQYLDSPRTKEVEILEGHFSMKKFSKQLINWIVPLE